MIRYFYTLVGLVAFASSAMASSLTVRDIQLSGDGLVKVQLDGVIAKNAFEIDYVRDIVQFSIQNATIYPAKILHSEGKGDAFSKVFAYQYAPNLVRLRFSVDGRADAFKGKVRYDQNGKTLSIHFPKAIAAAPKEENNDKEGSLLAKVLGQKAEVKVEKIEADSAKGETAKQEVSKPEVAKTDTKKNHLTGAIVSTPLTNSSTLGGAKTGPSALRSLFAMFLVVGGLGLVLIYVKKKKNGAQASKVGDSWLSGLISGSKRQKAMIEVIATHSLGPKQSITVVRIRGQQFVLGVSADSVQLISQLDADDAEVGVLDDPRVADSIGRMFGSKPQVIPTQAPSAKAVTPTPTRVAQKAPDLGASFNAMLKSSSGAGAIVARNAYQNQAEPATVTPSAAVTTPGVRSQLKQRLQGMKSL